ncbi:aminotransferase class III-fold pyridoxal phosphate-dependent enzyme [Enterococcus faecalis]|nr:aminotransferase class III-fold pyridoxal phosphate-dependent enzyme [Enterococcus faecalis]
MKQQKKKYFWHPMMDTKASEEDTIIIKSGDGNFVYDDSGRKLLDGVGGLWCVNVGHNRKEIKQSICKQMDKLSYYQIFTNVAHPKAYELAEKIISMTTKEEMSKVFFTSGGSDSVDTALKISRQYWEAKGRPTKKKFISLDKAYHGMHYGGTSIGGNQMYKKFVGPTLEKCVKVSSPHLKNNIWNCNDPEELTKLCMDELEQTIKEHGSQNIAALIAEPVQGAGGVIVPPKSYWPALRKMCDKYDILLIADEVVTGFGRSGCMFGARGWGVKPDVMVLAKGLSSGYIPIGAAVFNKRIVEGIESASNGANIIIHGQTYSGHPLGCVASIEALKIVENEELVNNAKNVGEYLIERLKPFMQRYDCVSDVRGKGLMIAIDFENNCFEQDQENVQFVADCAVEAGVLIRGHLHTIIISPPLTFSKKEADQVYDAIQFGLDRLEKNI